MKRNNKNQGFTLIEIMIVVLIIGILIAIAVPNFVRARATSRLRTIEANLKQIDAATAQWAMESGATSTTAVTQGDLDGTGGSPAYLVWPTGPVTGAYLPPATVGDTESTFDGGTKGAQKYDDWVANCTADPSSCGL